MAIVTNKKGWISWGFDLTDFGEDEKVFVALLKRHKLSNYKKVLAEYGDGKVHHFVWSNKGLVLMTANNPITGEFNQPAQRKREKGYASYIGIDGEEKLVKALAKDIRTVGNIKDESPNRRDFV